MIKPIISIIIPAYNAASFIHTSVDSVLSQSIPNDIEIIIVNDGSTDNTINVVENYMQEHSNIHLINQKNSGVSGARNSGIEAAQGEFIAFIDADDFISDGCLETIIKRLVNIDEKTEIVYLLSSLFPSKINCSTWIKRLPNGGVISGKDCFEKVGLMHTVWGCLYKKAFIEKYNLRFAEGVKNSEDTMYMAECQSYINQVEFWPIQFYNYVYREGSASNNVSEEKLLRYSVGLDYAKKICSSNINYPNGCSFVNENLYLYIANLTVASIRSPFGSCNKIMRHFKIREYLPLQYDSKSSLASRIKIINFSYPLYYFIMFLMHKVVRIKRNEC